MDAYRRTKIVATWGPSLASPLSLRGAVRAGVNVFRLNAAHATHEELAEAIPAIRNAADEEGKAVALLQDIQGPRLRTGVLASGEVALEQDAVVVVAGDAEASADGVVAVPHPGFAADLRVGDRILIADGTMVLRVESQGAARVRARVEQGGRLGAHKGVNLPDTAVSIPPLTDKDREDMAFGVKQGVDYVALSFVRRRDDLLECRRLLHSLGGRSPIIAKIEHPEALADLDGVLTASDGVMVARGDLGVELSPERVPMAQKRIIRRAIEMGVPVITATQMLESMISRPTPTRAEASDVANAILDGTDALMLSAETAVGGYPIHAVETMARIAVETEANAEPARFSYPTNEQGHLMAAHAASLASDLKADALLVFTRSGHSAELLSHQRPRAPIYAMTTDPAVRRRLALIYGVTPVLADLAEGDSAVMVEYGLQTLLRRGLVEDGARVLVLGSSPALGRGLTNLITVRTASRAGL